MKQTLYTAIFCLFAMGVSYAQEAGMVKDINPGSANSAINQMTAFGDLLIFRANDGENGVEPWISDGTEEGTYMIKDINDSESFAGNSNPSDFTVFNDLVYFKARSLEFGDELWVTDGTEDGTSQVIDIQEGPGNANPFNIVIFQNKMWFTANDGEVSSEMWVSDGTAEGTQLFLDINPGSGPGNPNFKTVIGNNMYFSANDGENGIEPWITDGTVEGTRMIADIRTEGNGNSVPQQFTPLGDKVVFRANDGESGVELWITDGTEEGTVLLADINEGSANSTPNFLTAIGDRVYFVANDGDGNKLYYTDGTTEGTEPAVDDTGKFIEGASNLTLVYENVIYFSAERESEGAELWAIVAEVDEELGVFSYEILNADLVPGPEGSSPNNFVAMETTGEFFSGLDADGNRTLYSILFLESPELFEVESDVDPAVRFLTAVGNMLYFEAETSEAGKELWALNTRALLPELLIQLDSLLFDQDEDIDFGVVLIGQDSTRTLTIQNVGGGELFFLPFILPEEFEIDFDINEAEEFIGLDITFAPEEVGGVFDFFVLVSNDPDNFIILGFLTGFGEMGVNTEDLLAPQFKLFPIPATSQIHAGFEKDLGAVDIFIRDMSGNIIQRVQRASSDQNVIQVSGLPSGMYLLEFNVGDQKIVKKFIKN